MNDLVKAEPTKPTETIETIFEKDGRLLISSRVIAKELDKQHPHVVAKIKEILAISEFCEREYTTSEGNKYKEYLLDKNAFILLVMNYSGYQDFKRAYINKFDEMEKALKEKQSPQTYSQALRALADEVDKRELLQLENKMVTQQFLEAKPKADYCDLILQSDKTMTVTMIAKDYGMSARTFNKLLRDLKVQYKQSEMWFLYAEHQASGYTQSKTHNYVDNGISKTKLNTEWTQKGRLFLYNLLKNNDVLPMIER